MLLFKNEIPSVSQDQRFILSSIIDLHNNGNPIHYDATYNTGSFWNGLPRPQIIGDINPLTKNVKKIDIENTNFEPNSISSITWDPPFLITKTQSLLSKKYGSFKNPSQLFNHYDNALQEIIRILIPAGILIAKCQDLIHGSQLYLPHVYIINRSRDLGFHCLDYFIKVNPNLIDTKHVKKNSRKIHTYFLVLKKNTRINRTKKF